MKLTGSRFSSDYGPTAVILGASEGIGLAFAEELAALGRSLLLVARREEPLRKAVERLRNDYGIHADYLCLDLSKDDPWPVLSEALKSKNWGLVVYNAAASPIGQFLDLDLEAARRTVSVNVASPLDITHEAGNVLRRRFKETGRRGGIILLSSLSGLRGTPHVSAYAATKAWNLVLAEGAGAEMASQGVDLMACVAGATATPGYQDSLVSTGPGAPVQQPRQVARAALRNLGRRTMVIPGLANKLVAGLMYGLIPRRWATSILGKATSSLRIRRDAGL